MSSMQPQEMCTCRERDKEMYRDVDRCAEDSVSFTCWRPRSNVQAADEVQKAGHRKTAGHSGRDKV